jgi:hypothetical protein
VENLTEDEVREMHALYDRLVSRRGVAGSTAATSVEEVRDLRVEVRELKEEVEGGRGGRA